MEKLFYFVNAGLSRVTSTTLVEKVRNCVTLTTGNADFPTPTPTLVALTAKADELDAANQAYAFTRSRTERTTRDVAFAELKDMVHEFSGYVQATSAGDKEKIESVGLLTRRAASPPEPPKVPGNVRADTTAYDGRIDVRWAGVRNRLLYRLEIALDPNAVDGWSTLVLTSKTRHSVEGLESGRRYYFRVMSIGALGESPASEYANAKAA